MTWLKVLLITVSVLTAFQPSFAILDFIEAEIESEHQDERISTSECATPAAAKRRSRAESNAPRLVARLSAIRRPALRPAPAGLAAYRPTVPVPLLC